MNDLPRKTVEATPKICLWVRSLDPSDVMSWRSVAGRSGDVSEKVVGLPFMEVGISLSVVQRWWWLTLCKLCGVPLPHHLIDATRFATRGP